VFRGLKQRLQHGQGFLEPELAEKPADIVEQGKIGVHEE
jgi:hypothetical protein